MRQPSVTREPNWQREPVEVREPLSAARALSVARTLTDARPPLKALSHLTCPRGRFCRQWASRQRGPCLDCGPETRRLG